MATHAQEFGDLGGKIFGSGSKALVILMHGDNSKGGPVNYHYIWAAKIAKQNPDATVIGLIRPGYDDGGGQKSRGSHNKRRDHYTKTNNFLVANTIEKIKKRFPADKTILIGHSGGAAQAGTIIGRFPRIVDHGILLSCPCDLKAWRSSRGAKHWTRSQSPIDYIDGIPVETGITLIVGDQDKNTKPYLSEKYVKLAKQKGLNANLVLVSGGNHGGNEPLRNSLYEAAVRIVNN